MTGRVVVAGDWHGNTRWARHVIAHTSAAGCALVLHLGDFGIWPGRAGARFLADVEAQCATHEVTVLVTPGNHEDWDAIDAHPVQDRDDGFGAVKWFTDHVAVLPRGHRFTLTGQAVPRTVVSLGGAPSIDLLYRVAGRDWWPQEGITEDDVATVADGGPGDIMLAHDAPEPLVPKVEHIVTRNPGGWGSRELAYCARGRDLLTAAFTAVRPRLLAHGHYHVRDTATMTAGPPENPFTCQIESLAMDGETGNAVVLDLDTLTTVPLPEC